MSAACKSHPRSQRQSGFTLVELILVIVLLGVAGGMLSLFLKRPIEQYVLSARRAALTDVADTSLRRIARDVRKALPNSIRTSGTNCMEFIPTRTGARYRAQDLSAGDDTSLDFTKVDSTFNMLGGNTSFAGVVTAAGQQIATGDLIVVYNLGPGINDAYAADNTATVVSVGAETANETPITMGGKKFPLSSGGSRFHVVPGNEKMVSYVCSGNTLYRTVGTTLSITPSCTATGSVLASNVDCANTSFNYSGTDLQRNATVSMVLRLRDGAAADPESVSLQHEVHVDNTP